MLALHPGSGVAVFLLPGLIQRPDRQTAAAAGPARRLIQSAIANRRTAPIAAASSQDARLSSRCVRSGVLSPISFAIVHPLRRGRSPITADV